MKNSVDHFFNMAANVSQRIRQELAQERKHALNPRCKPANWGSIASYISDKSVGLGEPVSEETVRDWAHNRNWED